MHQQDGQVLFEQIAQRLLVDPGTLEGDDRTRVGLEPRPYGEEVPCPWHRPVYNGCCCPSLQARVLAAAYS